MKYEANVVHGWRGKVSFKSRRKSYNFNQLILEDWLDSKEVKEMLNYTLKCI